MVDQQQHGNQIVGYSCDMSAATGEAMRYHSENGEVWVKIPEPSQTPGTGEIRGVIVNNERVFRK